MTAVAWRLSNGTIAILSLLPAMVGLSIAIQQNATIDWERVIDYLSVILAADLVMFGLERRHQETLEAVLLVAGPGILLTAVVLSDGVIDRRVLVIVGSLFLLATNALLVCEFTGPLVEDAGARWFGWLYGVAFAVPLLLALTEQSVALTGLLAGVLPADYAVWSLRTRRISTLATTRLATLVAYGAASVAVVITLHVA